MKPKLLFIVNNDKFFVSHRLPIARAALEKGFEVHIATSFSTYMEKLKTIGFFLHPIELNRKSVGLFSNSRSFFQMLSVIKKVKPKITHLVTIKPIIFGGLACRLFGQSKVVIAISGFGYIFTSEGLLSSIRRKLISIVYRFIFNNDKLRIIVQNSDDKAVVNSLMSGNARQKIMLIKGSGVNLKYCIAKPISRENPIVVMVSRLLGDKGVREFVEAARKIKIKRKSVRFVLVGEPDVGNPSSILHSEIHHWVAEGVIEWWGYRNDIPDVFASSYLVVLPSYREGLPKVLLEAAACARVIVTTDAPGCREAIKDGLTGLLVPVKSSRALAMAVESLLNDPNKCEQMGREGRKFAKNNFDINFVIMKHLRIYEELMSF